MWKNTHRSRALVQLDKGDREGAQRHTGTWTVINTQQSWFSGPGKQTCTFVASIGKCSACSCLGGQVLGMVGKEGAWKGAAGEWVELSRTHMVDAVPTSPSACPSTCCRDAGQGWHTNTVCLQGTSSGSVRKQLWELWHKTQTKPCDFTPRSLVRDHGTTVYVVRFSPSHSTSGVCEPFSHTLSKTQRDPVFPKGGFHFRRTYIPFLWETPVLRCITCARQPLQNYIEHILLWAILSYPILSCPRWLSIFNSNFFTPWSLGLGATPQRSLLL